MSIAAIKAGKAFYEIYANDKTAKGLSDAEASLRKFGVRIGLIGASMAGFAAAGLTGIGAMIKSFAGAGDNIADAMSVTGLSSDFLQTLKFAAADAGVGFDQLVASISKSNQAVAKAAAKGGTVAGLDAKALLAMSPDERYKALVNAIAGIGNQADRTTAAMAVFGRAGPKMLSAFEGGAEALNKQMAELRASGHIMSAEDLALAVKAEGAFLSMGNALSRVSQLIAAAVTPMFLKLMGVLESVVDSVITFIDNNRGLVVGLTVALVVIGAVGIALMGLGAVCIAASLAATGFAMVMSAIGIAAAVVASPIFIIVAAITACGIAALTAAFYLDQLFNAGAGFQGLADMATAAMTSIKALWTAIVNGRWDLAGQIITQSLTTAFYGAILTIKEAWNAMTIWMVEKVVNAMLELQGLLPQFVQDQMGLKALGEGGLIAMRAAGEMNLQDDRKRASAAGISLAETFAKIAAVDATRKVEVAQKASTLGNVAAKIQESSLVSGSTGAISSSGAARLGFAAPANSVDEKQLEVLQEIAKGQEDMIAGIEGLEGLTAD